MAPKPEAVRPLVKGLGLGAVCAAVVLAAVFTGALDTWEAKTWDWRVSVMAKPGPATDSIRLILLDQNSLDWAKNENGLTWPWPRELYGAIVNFCARHKAKALALDVLYTEPSGYGVMDDQAFARAAADFGKTAVAVFPGHETGTAEKWPDGLAPSPFVVQGLESWLETRPARHKSRLLPTRALFPIQELAQAASVLSNVHMNPDPDGVYRRLRLFEVFDGQVLPVLGLGLLAAQDRGVRARIEPGAVTLGDRTLPIDPGGNVILRYRGKSGTHKAFSAAAVIQGEIKAMGSEPDGFSADDFAGKYVIFGFSAPGLFDLRPSPVSGVYPGAEIHATFLDNYLSDDFIRAAPPWITALLVLLTSAGCSACGFFFTTALGGMAWGLFFLAISAAVCFFGYAAGFWLPLAAMELGTGLAMLATLAVNYATEGRQKRFIKQAFKQYLSPHVIEQIIRQPDRLVLGGERKTLSIFFSDLQGFTTISEGLTPEALTALLNDYLSEMTDIIQDEGGTVDKYEGDAIIAFWNAPLEVPDHAVRCVRSALRCQARLAELRPVIQKRIGKQLKMRIGMNTGPAVVGNLGSATRFDYTMLGDAVNLAARLEGANKQFGTYTMVSESTKDLLGDGFRFRELARLAVVGKNLPVRVFEPMFAKDYPANAQVYETFANALDSFYKGEFEKALAIFDTQAEIDPASRSYADKCRFLMENPPQGFNGVWVMTTK